jgi:hypothetical protein
MDAILKPEYEIKLKYVESLGLALARVSVHEPAEVLFDLSNIYNSHFPLLITEIEEVLAGTRDVSSSFGGERVTCYAYPDLTECYDMHEDTIVNVDTYWMLNLLKEFWAFKQEHFEQEKKKEHDS